MNTHKRIEIILSFILSGHNKTNAEEAEKGYILNIIFRKINPLYIEDKIHRDIFECCLDLYFKNIQINEYSLKDGLIKLGYSENKIFSDLMQISKTDFVSNRKYIESVIGDIVKSGQTQEIRNKFKDLDISLGKRDLDNVYSELQKLIEKWNTDEKNSLLKANVIAKETVDKIIQLGKNNKYITGLSTGFDGLDKITRGFQPGNLIILAARTGVGKTAFALSIAKNVCDLSTDDGKVLFFSLEMSNTELMLRLLSSKSKIPLEKISTGQLSKEEKATLAIVSNEISGYNLFINEISSLSPLALTLLAKDISSKGEIKLIVVDYLQLLENSSARKSREQEVSQISRSLKILARELNIPILALSQLSRKPEGRQDKRPIMSDLRESGSIEQDADIILFLYREDYYENKKDPMIVNKSPESNNDVELIIAKHRNGRTGSINLSFFKKYVLFSNSYSNN